MKRTTLPKLLAAIAITVCFTTAQQANAQSIHFSQYYNAPMLLNPANTALLPDNDYRIGANYRTQWASVPVPYKTFSAYGDLEAFRGESGTNWMGIGAALFSDKAGDGDLSLTSAAAFLSYHLMMGEQFMVSAGGSAAYVQRSINYDKLTFDAQWDGFGFNPILANHEKGGILKINYFDVSAGINLAFLPNDNVYAKLGLGMANINQPKQSFYGQDAKVSMRPTGNLDVLWRLSKTVILNPSVYYTTQDKASEALYGTLFRINITPEKEGVGNNQLILGGYHRLGDAVIGVVGVEFVGIQIMANYDYTISSLKTYNQGKGALEFSLVYQGVYDRSHRGRNNIHCPRF
jgi:type IX secretion system PorP/SprF family membrane protein